MIDTSRAIKEAKARVVAPMPEIVLPSARIIDRALNTFNVSAPQHDFLTDHDTFLLGLIGGIGSGKTFSLARAIRAKMRYEAGTGTIGGIFANTYQQLNQATLPELWKAFEEIDFEYGRDYIFGEMPPKFWRGFRSKFGKKHNNVLSVREWGQAICRSLETYENIRGIELGWAMQDEARNAKREAFDVVIGRLRCPRARKRIYRIVTSPNGFDWLYEVLVEDPAKRPELASERRLIHTKTTDNPTLDDHYISTMLSMYDPRFAAQEIEGKFVLTTSGQVYHQFDRTKHLKKINPAPNIGFQVCFDFNRSPFSVIICQTVKSATVKSDIIFAVDEVVVNDCGTSEMCREVIRRLGSYGDQQGNIEIYGDASGRHRDTRNNLTDYDIITNEFAKYGSRLKRKWGTRNPPVTARVNAVNAALMNAKGDTRLYISEKCEKLRKDFERVIWKEGTSDIDKITDKTLTHTSDALGYYVFEKFPVSTRLASTITI